MERLGAPGFPVLSDRGFADLVAKQIGRGDSEVLSDLP